MSLRVRVSASALAGALLLLCLGAPAAQASVVREQPNPGTVDRSQAIALAKLVRVRGQGPFTHGAPPEALVFEVTRALKGCQVKQSLEVSHWRSSGPPKSKGGKRSPGRLRAWKASPVVLPKVGGEVLLLLTRANEQQPWRQTLDGWAAPVTFVQPSARVLALTHGLLCFQLSLRPQAKAFAAGVEPTLELVVQNRSAGPQRFDPGQVSLLAASVGSRSLLKGARPAQGLASFVLKPKASRTLTLRLQAHFRLAIPKPGAVALRFELPGRVRGSYFARARFQQR